MKTIVLLASVATVLVSCHHHHDSDDEIVVEDEVSLTEIKLNASIVTTRTSDVEWESGDLIGVYMFEAGTTESTDLGYDNAEYEADDDGKSSSFSPVYDDQTAYYPEDGSEVDIIAYHPYSQSVANGVLDIDLSDQSDQKAVDVMVSDLAESRSVEKYSASVVFYHKLVKLLFYISAGDGFDEANLEGLGIALTEQKVEGEIDVTDPDSEAEATSASGETVEMYAESDGLSGEGIVFPSTDVDGMAVEVSNITGYEDFSFDLADVGVENLLAGYCYIFSIKVNEVEEEEEENEGEGDDGSGEGDDGDDSGEGDDGDGSGEGDGGDGSGEGDGGDDSGEGDDGDDSGEGDGGDESGDDEDAPLAFSVNCTIVSWSDVTYDVDVLY